MKHDYSKIVPLSRAELRGFTVIEASTCHITEKDSDILEKNVEKEQTKHPQVILQYEQGFFVSTWHPTLSDIGCLEAWNIFEKKLKDIGHSEAYINLIMVAHDSGAKWLNLDSDSSDYDFLPRFEW